jgi:hypothetical protein
MKPIRRDGWSISAIVLQFDAQHMNGRDRPYGPLTARGGESDARACPRQPQGAQNLCVIRFMAIASFLLWTIGGLDMGCASDTEGRTPPGESAIIVEKKRCYSSVRSKLRDPTEVGRPIGPSRKIWAFPSGNRRVGGISSRSQFQRSMRAAARVIRER